jgi:hypothetical protein
MDVVQEEDKPVEEVYTTCLATAQHGVHYSSGVAVISI